MAEDSQELSGKDNGRASCAPSRWLSHRNLLVSFLDSSLQSCLVHEVAGWLWLDSLAQHHASLSLVCHQTDMPLGKTDSCFLLKYSSHNTGWRHPIQLSLLLRTATGQGRRRSFLFLRVPSASTLCALVDTIDFCTPSPFHDQEQSFA